MSRHWNQDYRRGAIAPLAAIVLPLLLLLAAMATNLAYVQYCQTELEISTDCAARAASRIYSTTGDKAQAVAVAREAGRLNPVAGIDMNFRDQDIVFGQSVRTSIANRYDFQPNVTPENAVEVSGVRDSTNTAIATFLPELMGSDSMEIAARSVSARVEVDLALVIDRSGSMAYSDSELAVYPPIPAAAPYGWDFGAPVPPSSRWLDVVDGVNTLLTELNKGAQAERVSLTTYADDAWTDSPLNSSYSSVLMGLAHYTSIFDGGGTNIEAGISEGANTLLSSSGSRPFAAKVILVLTDGRRTVGSSPVTASEHASEQGLMVFTVTFSNEADQYLMKDVADAGGGQHFHANKREDLIEVFRTIGQKLPTLLVK